MSLSQRWVRDLIFADVTAAKAAGRPDEVCYVQSMKTFYDYVVAGSGYTANDTSILTTGNGGDTRWIARAGQLNITEAEIVLDAAGAVTVTQMRHKVDTFENAASDDLVTLNGGTTVDMVVLRAEADARTIVVKHGTGNIWLQGKADISLDDLEDGILLFWDSTNSKWFDIGGGGGGAGDVTAAANITANAPVVGDDGAKGVKKYVTNILNLVQMSRSQFTYSDADQITCAAAQYMCKDKYCYWVSTITTVATGAAGGAEFWYLYLDYSAITSGTVLTASELVWSTTAPTFNTTYRQWMNGDDRCIFAVKTTAANAILEFLHDGDLCIFADAITVTDNVDPDTTWTDSTQVIPAFTQKTLVTFEARYSDVSRKLFWRTNGQTGTIGHFVGYVTAGSTILSNTFLVITDSVGKIEFKYSDSGAGGVYIYTNGWVFSTGM
jgi:hypothetical protein